MTAVVEPKGDVVERRRYRRALLDSLSEGEAFALDVHTRMRLRGFDVAELAVLFATLIVLEQSGLASSRLAPNPDPSWKRPRRLFKITDAGVRERERLGVP